MMRFTDRPPEPPCVRSLVEILVMYHSYDPVETEFPGLVYGDLDGECELCGEPAMFNRCQKHAYGTRGKQV